LFGTLALMLKMSSTFSPPYAERSSVSGEKSEAIRSLDV